MLLKLSVVSFGWLQMREALEILWEILVLVHCDRSRLLRDMLSLHGLMNLMHYLVS